MPGIALQEIRSACEVVYRHMTPTPQISWPLLNERTGVEVIVKHDYNTRILSS